MTLLLPFSAVSVRREQACSALAPLADSLAAELAPPGSLPEMPAKKALLSREGGRCPADGSMLEFDPRQPYRHRCTTCAREYEGERHHRMWIMWQQLWLAERSVVGATLHLLTGSEHGAAVARQLLGQATRVYATLPNCDNVLGPSRPFFSTYLESIWLLQLCVALDLLEMAGVRDDLPDRVRKRVIEPSAELIASFDEGASNRQVWNAAALLAAGVVLDRDDLITTAVDGRSGLRFHLEHGLLGDGTWYEGENYHLFAHRGLWYGVTMCEVHGIAVDASLLSRFNEAFATPLLTALPDMTFPSRRDSQYAVSLRQWRFAESLELGFARTGDGRLAAGLHSLYTFDGPRRDTGRWCSTAEAERNQPASRLSRADLGWKSLLFAAAELPRTGDVDAAGSVLLASQGFAVLRPPPRPDVYAALDYGEPGGGHGHPDRLGVLLAVGDARWLDDPGTGSYVDPTLFWYRSTLAHNAPLVDGVSQRPVRGRLRAFDSHGGASWVDAELPAIATSGVRFRRTLVALDGYLLDTIAWDGGAGHVIDLPFHVPYDAAVGPEWVPADLTEAASGDGFAFLRDVQSTTTDRRMRLEIDAASHPGAADMIVHLPADGRACWWRARHPGAPGAADGALLALRAQGASGMLVSVWSWSKPVEIIAADARQTTLRLPGGETHTHESSPSGWRIARGTAPVIALGGIRELPTVTPEQPDAERRLRHAPIIISRRRPFVRELAEESYRRSEHSWRMAGEPRAHVEVSVMGADLRVTVEVRKQPLIFRARGDDPALDNEHPDIHSDGVQVHLLTGDALAQAAWLIVPEPGANQVRIRRTGHAQPADPSCTCARLADGYRVGMTFPLEAITSPRTRTFALDVLVNEIGAGRVRRRGQLVLSGGAGEYVYLRGDRQPPDRFLWFEVVDE